MKLYFSITSPFAMQTYSQLYDSAYISHITKMKFEFFLITESQFVKRLKFYVCMHVCMYVCMHACPAYFILCLRCHFYIFFHFSAVKTNARKTDQNGQLDFILNLLH